MKRFRVLTAALCAAVLLCGFTPATAYAGGGEDWEGLDPVEPAVTEEPVIEPGEGFSEDGNLVTRDLLYDKHTNKQFITVQTSGGATFYIVIDYDKPVDEDGEQYQTYFLNTVDEADLLAAAEAAGVELASCSCSDKCAAGAVNTDCAVCAVNMWPSPTPSRKQKKATPGCSCWCWPWRCWAAGPRSISRCTAPNSRRQQSRRRTTARNWRTMTARRTARPGMRTRTKTRIRRTGNEFHSKLF